jgi:hypothetical protein
MRLADGAAARPARRATLFAVTASTIVLVACFHDFDAFDPLPSTGDDGGSANATGDAKSEAAPTPTPDANGVQTPPVDGAPPPTFDAASGCGADCRIEATSCAGTCAEIEQSCAAACDGGTCTNDCESKESTCVSNCVTSCETCTSGEGCIDQAGCTAAAP